MPTTSFGKDGGANYLRYECKECARKQAKILREIKKSAPPIPEDYRCPICNRNETEAKGYNKNKKFVWCADHDHKTNRFRGWLCHKCNLGLGNFDDDLERLKKSIEYLKKDRKHFMKIPFFLLPASWGLKGKTRQIAEAEYLYEGYNLECKLAEIEHADDSVGLNKSLLDIKLKYNKIDQYTYDSELSAISKEGNDLELAKLDIDLKHNKISTTEYERKKADIVGEPWISMPKISWDPVSSTKTFLELDYNDHFINFLRKNGYTGTDDECINRWLNDICNSILDEMSQEDPDFVTTVKRIRRDDGKVEHS